MAERTLSRPTVAPRRRSSRPSIRVSGRAPRCWHRKWNRVARSADLVTTSTESSPVRYRRWHCSAVSRQLPARGWPLPHRSAPDRVHIIGRWLKGPCVTRLSIVFPEKPALQLQAGRPTPGVRISTFLALFISRIGAKHGSNAPNRASAFQEPEFHRPAPHRSQHRKT